MTQEISGTMTQMAWRPKLLKLTQIGNPDWGDGKPTICFLDPSSITRISSVVAAFPKRENPAEKWPDVFCTEVFFCHGSLHVIETPEQVALMRDLAFGLVEKLKSV